MTRIGGEKEKSWKPVEADLSDASNDARSRDEGWQIQSLSRLVEATS